MIAQRKSDIQYKYASFVFVRTRVRARAGGPSIAGSPSRAEEAALAELRGSAILPRDPRAREMEDLSGTERESMLARQYTRQLGSLDARERKRREREALQREPGRGFALAYTIAY